MDLLTTLVISVGLAMDAFAVSVGVGTTQLAKSIRPVFRLSFHMGLFQGLMTVLGWLAGANIERFISAIDHWVALGLLAFVGLRMIRSGLNPEIDKGQPDPSRGGTLIVICIATSIDAFAVGLSLAMIQAHILSSALWIAIVTLLLSLTGLFAGDRLGLHFGKRMEIFGGLLLNGIGLRIVLTHLF